MKKYYLYFLVALVTSLSNGVLTSCDKDEVDVNDVLTIKSVLPTKIIEGQTVTITGSGLNKASAVVFPGEIVVTDIEKIGNGYITVVTPAGVSGEGGNITVEADGESVKSAFSLSVGRPSPERVAPLDKEIKINECLEVYGSDLEFITSAVFPGKDGTEIEVNAKNFKRKATGSLAIYVPSGIVGGVVAVTLKDCSGKKYILPEVLLSDKVAGGSTQQGEGYYPVWEGSTYIYDWANWQYMTTDQFNLEGISLREGLMMRLTIDNPAGASVCVCDANWGTPNVDGEGNNTKWVEGGVTELEFPISQGMVETFQNGNGIIIGGGNFTLLKIELYREYPVLWEGEYTTGWWWYLPATDLNLSAVTPEAGQTIRFTFTHHDEPQTFCLCDGWWGAPFIRDGGESANNIVLAGGEDFLEFEISDGMAQTMNGTETALIIGGDITVTKIQIKTF